MKADAKGLIKSQSLEVCLTERTKKLREGNFGSVKVMPRKDMSYTHARHVATVSVGGSAVPEQLPRSFAWRRVGLMGRAPRSLRDLHLDRSARHHIDAVDDQAWASTWTAQHGPQAFAHGSVRGAD